MPWFGHRAGCPAPRTPRYEPDTASVCVACMPAFAPACAMCGLAAPRLEPVDGFARFAFWSLCPACVARVRAAGPWKERRRAALVARVEAVTERHAGVVVTEVAARRVTLGGAIGARAVRLTLKIAAREGDDERYVIRVAVGAAVPLGPAAADLGDLAPGRRGARVVEDDHRWLRVPFLHLGKGDLLDAIDRVWAAAAALDAGSQEIAADPEPAQSGRPSRCS